MVPRKPRAVTRAEKNKVVRTDLHVPYALSKRIDELTETIGISKKAFFMLAAALFICKLSQIHMRGKKRQSILNDIENIFETLMEESRNSI